MSGSNSDEKVVDTSSEVNKGSRESHENENEKGKGKGKGKAKGKEYTEHKIINKGVGYSPSKSGTNKFAKGSNKIRNTGKVINTLNKFNDSYALIFPNALPVKQIVWGLEPMNRVWRYCSIVYARPKKKELNKTDFMFPLNVHKSESVNKFQNEVAAHGLKEHDYDYYVHWEKLDRRMDCWMSYEHLRLLEQEPNDEYPKIKEPECPSEQDNEHAGIDKEYLREHEENTKLKTINKIKMGKYLVDTWYFSPYPKEYQNIDTLYICEFCLSFFKEEGELTRHTQRCEIRHPPGNEIYRSERNSIFEIDGNHFRIYCENLCFLSKLFLDHKTLKHRVNLFLFYVITELDDYGYHITGYFSKEKYSKNNVSCILTLPQHQKKGYGSYLISFSYFLSKKEMRAGTPERPLSDLGLASYMTYWYETLLQIILNYNKISIQELSELTSIDTNDIITCFGDKRILKNLPNGDYFLYINSDNVKRIIEKICRKKNNLRENDLHWVSYDYFFPIHE